ncbi:MAG: protocatechuate 3,4-dioxygenase subunit beta [Vulcanimicrobiaceae bacterium]
MNETRAFSLVPLRPDAPGTQPARLHSDYRSSINRAPLQPLVPIPQTLSELTGPTGNWERLMGQALADLTAVHTDEPLGERIVVSGRVVDEDERPIPETMIEIWQANAAGRYRHADDRHSAPLDPNFTGAGRVVTDAAGRYHFVTIKPGAYPWSNHHNAWRPAHIHYSLFGPEIGTRLVTQMYFPGDPLIEFDPIANSVPRAARERMISHFDLDTTIPERALGYRFDFVLRGRADAFGRED